MIKTKLLILLFILICAVCSFGCTNNSIRTAPDPSNPTLVVITEAQRQAILEAIQDYQIKVELYRDSLLQLNVADDTNNVSYIRVAMENCGDGYIEWRRSFGVMKHALLEADELFTHNEVFLEPYREMKANHQALLVAWVTDDCLIKQDAILRWASSNVWLVNNIRYLVGTE